MSCRETRKYLGAYVDGELAAEQMLAVEAHVDDCETCAARVELERALKRELAALGDVRAPERLRRRVERISSRRRARRILAVAAVPAAAAAALVLALGVGAGDAGRADPLAAVVEDVVQRHSRDLPMEVRGPDPATAATWFCGKVDFPVRAPRLAIENASFEGARLSNVQSHQAAHMLYTVDGHRVTLMIFSADRIDLRGGERVRAGGREVTVGRRRGYNVAVLVEGDMAYALSSDLPAARLAGLFAQLGL